MKKLDPKFPLLNKLLSQVLTQLMKSSTLKPLLSSIKQDFNAHMHLTSNVSVPCEGTSINLIFQFIDACDVSLHEALIPPTSTSSSTLNANSSQSLISSSTSSSFAPTIAAIKQSSLSFADDAKPPTSSQDEQTKATLLKPSDDQLQQLASRNDLKPESQPVIAAIC